MRRRRRGLAAAAACLRDPRRRGDGRLDELVGPAVPADADGDAAQRAPERQPGRPAERAGPACGRPRCRGADRPSGRQARALRGPRPADGLRPRRLHPLRALRAVHAGGDAVLRALARGPRRRVADRPDVGQVVARHRVRALRRLPFGLPDRRDLREVRRGRADRPRGPAGEDEDDVHVLRRRLPDRPERRPGDEADRQGHVGPVLRLQRRQPVRQGPLRLQLRPPPGPADHAADPRRGRQAALCQLASSPTGCGGGLAGRPRAARPAGDRVPLVGTD